MKRPTQSYAVQMICTWLAVVLFFALLWKFPAEAHWLFGPFRDHLAGG